MILYCLRHGHAQHNINKIMSGDPSKIFHLTELGKQQAQEAAEQLKEVPLEIIYTSEMLRTIQTAEIINKYHKVEIKNDPRLNDLKSGLEGKRYAEYKEKQKKASEIQKVDIYHAKVNDGESLEEEKQRTYNFLDELKTKNHKNVLITAHFDTIIFINGYANNLTNKEMNKIKPQKGEIYKFEI